MARGLAESALEMLSGDREARGEGGGGESVAGLAADGLGGFEDERLPSAAPACRFAPHNHQRAVEGRIVFSRKERRGRKGILIRKVFAFLCVLCGQNFRQGAGGKEAGAFEIDVNRGEGDWRRGDVMSFGSAVYAHKGRGLRDMAVAGMERDGRFDGREVVRREDCDVIWQRRGPFFKPCHSRLVRLNAVRREDGAFVPRLGAKGAKRGDALLRPPQRGVPVRDGGERWGAPGGEFAKSRLCDGGIVAEYGTRTATAIRFAGIDDDDRHLQPIARPFYAVKARPSRIADAADHVAGAHHLTQRRWRKAIDLDGFHYPADSPGEAQHPFSEAPVIDGVFGRMQVEDLVSHLRRSLPHRRDSTSCATS